MAGLRVAVRSSDPLIREGLIGYLADSAEIAVVGDDLADVLLVGIAVLKFPDCRALSAVVSESLAPVVLVAGWIPSAEVTEYISRHLCAIIPVSEASPQVLYQNVLVAIGAERTLPSPFGTRKAFESGTDLSDRELKVLRLVADGLSVDEIAVRLSFSVRMVKYITYGFVTKLQARNRTHAVALAVRTGLM